MKKYIHKYSLHNNIHSFIYDAYSFSDIDYNKISHIPYYIILMNCYIFDNLYYYIFYTNPLYYNVIGFKLKTPLYIYNYNKTEYDIRIYISGSFYLNFHTHHIKNFNDISITKITKYVGGYGYDYKYINNYIEL